MDLNVLNPMTGILMRERQRKICDTDTEEKSREDGGRNWSAVSTSQEMPRTAGSHQKLGERHGTDSPSESLEELNATNTLILDFWPPER